MSFRPGTIRSPSGAERSVSGLSRIELDPQQDRQRGQLQRMLVQPARSEPLLPCVPADDVAEQVAGIAGVD